jgi:MFS family permease
MSGSEPADRTEPADHTEPANGIDRWLDTRPLRLSRPFRRLWLGTTAAAFGFQITLVALLLQVWQLTASPAWVGAIGLAQALPMVAGAMLGGVLADTLDRRKLAIWATLAGIAAAVLLALQAVAGLGSVPLILALVAAQGFVSALKAPAQRAFIPRLLPRERVSAGVALTHVGFQAAMLGGPALAGLIAAGWGVAACYLLHAATACVALYAMVRLPAMPPLEATGDSGLRAALAGWRFTIRSRVLRGTLLTDLAATVLAMPIALFPIVNEQRFGGDPTTLGLFLSAVAVGGVAAGVTSGAITRYPRPGRVMLVAAAVWGVALGGFALATPLWLTLGCLLVAGAADTVSVISRGTIVQLATPDSHRGRVNAADHVIGAAGPQLGNFRGGLVADLTTSTVSLLSGAVLCVLAVAAVAATHPAVRRFDLTREQQPD